MFRLDSFKITDMLTCGADIRQFGLESQCVQEAGEKIVNYLDRNFEDEHGERAFASVRLFKTLRFDELDEQLKRDAVSNFSPNSETKFMTLMAAAGIKNDLSERREGQQHKVVPVDDTELLKSRFPMAAHMLARLETKSNTDDEPPEFLTEYLMEPRQKHFNVFHIPDVNQCTLVKDSEFLRDLDVRSMLGFGGMLNRGSTFFVIIYSRSYIPRDTAELFNPLTLSTKNALIYATDFRKFAAQRQPA